MKLEADYLKKISIFEFKQSGILKNFYTYNSMKWIGDNSQINYEFYLVENLKEYLLGLEFAINGYLELKYQTSEKPVSYKVRLTTSECNYGGYRYWFMCPICSRRIGVLYLRNNYFACRECNKITYQSRNLSGRYKKIGRIISIKELESIEKAVKRKKYNGFVTRKYKRYLITAHKFGKIWNSYLGI